MKRLIVIAASVAVLVLAAASAALAGEIKGPPGTECFPEGSTQLPICNFTAAVTHSNSICSFSGLNDLNPDFGQTDRQTQTPKDGPPGTPGSKDPVTGRPTCGGGSNPHNPPSP